MSPRFSAPHCCGWSGECGQPCSGRQRTVTWATACRHCTLCDTGSRSALSLPSISGVGPPTSCSYAWITTTVPLTGISVGTDNLRGIGRPYGLLLRVPSSVESFQDLLFPFPGFQQQQQLGIKPSALSTNEKVTSIAKTPLPEFKLEGC